MNRPPWCPDQTCRPLNYIQVEDVGICFGKVAIPGNHGTLKGVNDISWCLKSEQFSRWLINRDDLATFFIMAARALKDDGQPFPMWVVEQAAELAEDPGSPAP